MSNINEENNLKKIKVPDPLRYKTFLEELAWLLASHSSIDYKLMPDIVSRYFLSIPKQESTISQYLSDNPNKQFLVGVLPNLLIDETLFSTNEDIAQFAKTVMKLDLLRYDKKSRYEIIGTIVCKANKLNDYDLNELVHALTVITRKKDTAKKFIIERRKEHFGWNSIIQELAKEDVDGKNSQLRL